MRWWRCVIEGYLIRLEGLRVWGSGCGSGGCRGDGDGEQCVGLAEKTKFSILQCGGEVHARDGGVPLFQL